MKNIKFRGWYGSKLGMMTPTFNGDINKIFSEKHGDYMQYTGLKDCKGVEIYEEDIVQTPFMKSKGYAYRCVYSSKVGAYLLVPFKVGEHITPVKGVKEFAKSWEEIEHEGEVIGNIYEHPELIQSSYA